MEAKSVINIKCDYCSSLVPAGTKCTNCGAGLRQAESRYEVKTFTVQADRAREALTILSKCGFQEKEPRMRTGNQVDLKVQRNMNMPNYHAVSKLTDEVLADFDPPQPRKRFITPMVFMIILGSIALMFMWVALMVGMSGSLATGTGAEPYLSTVSGTFLIVALVFLAPAVLCMIFMIKNIVKFQKVKKTYNATLTRMRRNADLCEKMVSGVEVDLDGIC